MRVFPVEKREFLQIQISLGIQILFFWITFTQKGYLQPKTEKLNTTSEFCMFELVQVPNFSLRNFYFLNQVYP